MNKTLKISIKSIGPAGEETLKGEFYVPVEDEPKEGEKRKERLLVNIGNIEFLMNANGKIMDFIIPRDINKINQDYVHDNMILAEENNRLKRKISELKETILKY